MLFLIRFTDKPGTLAQRQALLQAHCDWLAERRDTVLVAGSLRTEPSAAPVGGAWVVEVPSKADAEAVYLGDPFWTAGLRQNVEVLHWSKALPERALV
jgi:uncharacterized protein YciI